MRSISGRAARSSSSSSNSDRSSQSGSHNKKLFDGLQQIGKTLSMSRTKDTGGEREDDVLRDDCRDLAAAWKPVASPANISTRGQKSKEDDVLRDDSRNLVVVPSPAGDSRGSGGLARVSTLGLERSRNLADASSPTGNSSGTASPVNKERLNSARNKFRSSVRAMMFARSMKQTAEPDISPVSTPPPPADTSGTIVVEPLTPEKLNGRGDNFFFSAVLSEKIRACGQLGEDSTRIRVPVLTLAEYSGPVSKSRWFVDAFTLPHNAVRRECMDVYELVIGIAKLNGPDDIMSDDIISFYEWWEVATVFFQRYFDVERKVLIPWVDAIGNADGHVRMALRKMRGMKETLKGLLANVDQEWTKRDTQPAENTFSAVYKAVDAFVPRFMNYLADQEVLLPMLVKDKYTIDDRVKMEKELVTSFLRDDNNNSTQENASSNHNIVLLVRWIGNPRQLRAWVSKYLSSSHRQAFPTWLRTFQMEHERFVKNIKDRTGSPS